MILTGQTIRALGIITPHEPRTVFNGMTYGESLAGYDIRLGEAVPLRMGLTTLGVSLERFDLPNDVLGRVCDKSTWARRGVSVQNTVLEPGWRGFLTLEIALMPTWRYGAEVEWGLSGSQPAIACPLHDCIDMPAGTPIAQVIFERIECETPGYCGKYQDQPAHPVEAIMEPGAAE